MSEVVPLHPLRPGERSFLTCACGDGDTMAVVVMHDAQGEFICAPVCAGCEQEIPVGYGRPER